MFSTYNNTNNLPTIIPNYIPIVKNVVSYYSSTYKYYKISRKTNDIYLLLPEMPSCPPHIITHYLLNIPNNLPLLPTLTTNLTIPPGLEINNNISFPPGLNISNNKSFPPGLEINNNISFPPGLDICNNKSFPPGLEINNNISFPPGLNNNKSFPPGLNNNKSFPPGL